MEPDFAKIYKELRFLKLYATVSTILLLAVGLTAFTRSGTTHFKEISVERINILEPNGQLRMVLANQSRSPGVLAYGKPFTPPIAGGNRPGLIFYNDEGSENGGLVFRGGTDSAGKYFATGHLSFDQYNQNQVLYLSYLDDNGDQNTGLHIDDWQKTPSFQDWRAEYKRLQALPDGPGKEALLKKAMEPKQGQKAMAERVFVGKNDSKAALIALSDRMGQPRLQMLVDSNGTAKLNFLDPQGKIVYSLPK